MTELYLRSRLRRGRWFHYYRRDGKEISLGVHGLPPEDPRVKAAYWAEQMRWQDMPPEAKTPKANTFAWAWDIYQTTHHWREELSGTTRQNRTAIMRRYLASQADRPLGTITREDIETALFAKGGFAAINELKALRPVFRHAKRLRIIKTDPTAGIELDKPKSKGFAVAGADDIERFIERWEIGTTERLIFDLALFTGAARTDLARIGRANLSDGLLTYKRQKSGVEAVVPVTPELRAVIARTPDIAPAFILTSLGKPFTGPGLGNRFGEAASTAGITARLHGLRKAFCIYWAEQGKTTHQIAAMAGHLTLAEVQRYTAAADRRRVVKLIVGGS